MHCPSPSVPSPKPTSQTAGPGGRAPFCTDTGRKVKGRVGAGAWAWRRLLYARQPVLPVETDQLLPPLRQTGTTKTWWGDGTETDLRKIC